MRIRIYQYLAFLFVCLLLVIFHIYMSSVTRGSKFHEELRNTQILSSTVFNSKLRCLELREPMFHQENTEEIHGVFAEDMERLREKFLFPIHPKAVMKRLKTSVCDVRAEKTAGAVTVHFIKSSLGNGKRRDVIRETWASVKVVANTRHEIVFLLGRTPLDGVQEQIEKESGKYGDILQFDRDDSAKNLPLKVLAGMQWASEYMQAHWLYTSCDDDVIVNPFNLAMLLTTLTDQPQSMSTPRGGSGGGGKLVNERPCYEQLPVICLYSYQATDVPARNPESKWYVSTDMYPPVQWPPHCRGGLYAMSVAMTSELYAISRTTAYLHLDDVWITGLMRRKLGRGDTNIYAAPYSQRKNSELLTTDRDVPLSNMLLRHLWGNIDGLKVDIIEEMKKEWTPLRWKRKKTSDECYL